MSRTGRQAPRRPARCPRNRGRVLRAGRELSRAARRSLRLADPSDHVPARSERGEHGGGLRQADRPARCLHGHPRAGRDPGGGRSAHRVSGFDTAAASRRAGVVGAGGARGVPGGRLPPDVRPAGEVGRADRPGRSHPRADCTRVHDRLRRPARPGRPRAARGHARRLERRRRRAGIPSHAAEPGRRRHRGAPRAARPRRAALRDRRRRWLDTCGRNRSADLPRGK